MSRSVPTHVTGTPRVATATDRPIVTRILVEAFQDDPMWGPWAFPDPHARRRGREAVFTVLVEGAMRYPWVWLTTDHAAAAVWIPPGETELSPAQERRIDSILRDSLGADVDAVLDAFERFEQARPEEPHFYLTLLGTDPAHHGRRIGQGLLSANLGQVDARGAPAYLEAADELVALYERFGFRSLSRFALPDGPTVNGMWREPRNTKPG